MMSEKVKWSFLFLVIVQGLHSIEEYLGALWETFPPAEFLCSLVSDNLVNGFLIINIGLFIFGLWCWMFPVSKNYTYAPFLIWFWVIIEGLNGIVHPIWSLFQKQYTPGVITAPILLIVAIYLFLEFKKILSKYQDRSI